MPSTYTTNLGIEKIATGEQSGTWGTTTNTNLDLIDQAVNGVEQVTLSVAGSSGSPNDLPITNGASSDGRNKFIEFVDGADLGGTAYVQLTPNDAEKIVFFRNSLSASRSVIVFQGTYNASNDFEIPNGADVVLKFDGAGAGAVVSDVYVNLTPTKLTTAEAQVDNININGNAITSTDTNGNIAITPDGTGEVDISKVDIDSGTIDGVTIGGASAGAGTFTNLTATGTTTLAGASTSADITFGDNDKAIFGAGSDLQIYHDGSNSIIEDVGTGPLRIRGTSISIENELGTETLSNSSQDGAVTIYYDGSPKLATTNTGIDVTGTVTADGLTVDGNAATITLNNTDTTTETGQTLGSISFTTADASAPGTTAKINTEFVGFSGATDLYLQTGTASSLKDRLKISFDGDISFYEDTGITPKLFWDASAESLGIGTTSPNSFLPLTLGETIGSYTGIHFDASDGPWNIFVDDGAFQIRTGTPGSGPTERMRIDSSGNVGIGVVPEAWNTYKAIQVGSTGYIASPSSGVYTQIGNNAYYDGAWKYTTTAAATNLNFSTGGDLLFQQAASGTADTAITWSEAMRIDSSGNLLVGATTASAFNNSTDVYGFNVYTSGQFAGSVNSAPVAYFNRQNSDGIIADFRKDGSTVGSIGAGNGDLLIGKADTEDCFLRFGGGGASIALCDSAGLNTNDGLVDLGRSSNRFKDLYLSGGVQGSGSVSLVTGGNSNTVKADGSLNSLWSLRDGIMDLGRSATRWKDLYLSGGVYLGGTGSANKLEDYEEGTWTPTITTLVNMTSVSWVTGSYTKIGRIVTIQGYFTCTITSSNTLTYAILTLPIAAGAENQTGSAFANNNLRVGVSDISSANIYPFFPAASQIVSGSEIIQVSATYTAS